MEIHKPRAISFYNTKTLWPIKEFALLSDLPNKLSNELVVFVNMVLPRSRSTCYGLLSCSTWGGGVRWRCGFSGRILHNLNFNIQRYGFSYGDSPNNNSNI